MPSSCPRRAARNALPGLAFALAIAACAEAPVTGRQQLILLPESQDAQMGLQAYQEIKQESNISRDPELNRRVQEVGRRIAEVSPQPEWDWEFTVFENDEPNAFALPGGKVGVHTGLFRVAENDDQLATVIGHEVAHAIARHSSERMSQALLAQGLGAIAVGTGVNPQVVDLAAQAATLGIILPYSRTQESEADHIGLMYMAEAGYDPRARSTYGRTSRRSAASVRPSSCRPTPNPARASKGCRS